MRNFRLLLLLLIICSQAINAQSFKVDGINYEIISDINKTVAVSENRNYIGNAIIPETIKYNGVTYSVATIGYKAFCDCTELTAVTIPNSVTTIGYKAFSNCTKLTAVTIPNSVTNIIEHAFFYCTGLAAVTIGNSVTKIGLAAFSECTSLKSVTIPNSVKTIEQSAFNACTSLTSVTIGNSVTSIGDWAFYYCTDLESVNIPNSVTSIGNSAFTKCTGLKSVTIPNSVTSLGNSAFAECKGLLSVTIGNSVTSIGDWAFNKCTGLKSVIIPNSVTSIGDWAFEDCTSLTSVTIGNSVTSIGKYAFLDCKELASVTIGNSVRSLNLNIFYNCDNIQCDNIQSMTIGNGVLSIEKNMPFSSPRKVILLPDTPPSGLKQIIHSTDITYVSNDNYSGDNLDKIKKYDFLNSMFEVGGVKYVPISLTEKTCAVIDCTYSPDDKNIVIGSTVQYNDTEWSVIEINKHALRNNTHIESINVSTNTSIPDYFAYRCSNVKEAILHSTESDLGDAATGLNTQLSQATNSIGSYAFASCKSLTEIKLPENLKKIEPMAFSYSGLEKITIPKEVTNIHDETFAECSQLSSIEIPNEIESIERAAFINCKSLTEIKLPERLKKIGGNAFYASGLETITIPRTVDEIGSNAFSGCKSLNTFITSDGETELKLYTKFDNCPLKEMYIGRKLVYDNYDKPFQYNRSLEKVTFSDIPTEVSDGMFYGCKNLKKVTLGDGVKKIGDFAFFECSSLATFSFGENTKTIGMDAFFCCSSLAEIDLPEGLKTIGSGAFYASRLKNITIPKTVDEIMYGAFANCSLNKFTISDGGTELKLEDIFHFSSLKEVYIGRKLVYGTTEKEGYSPFYKNVDLEKVTFSDIPTEVPTNLFYDCRNLKEVSLGDSMKKIGDYSFSGCSSLTTFHFGENIELIGKEAFSNCTAITKLYAEPTTPPVCDEKALDGIDKNKCTLYVKRAAKSNYQAADQWKEFFSIEDYDSTTAIDKVQMDIPQSDIYKVYNLQGSLIKVMNDKAELNSLPAGLYIINGKKVMVK